MSIKDHIDEYETLNTQLHQIFLEQQQYKPDTETVAVGGVIATRDKHTAIELILDFLGPDVSEFFEMIR